MWNLGSSLVQIAKLNNGNNGNIPKEAERYGTHPLAVKLGQETRWQQVDCFWYHDIISKLDFPFQTHPKLNLRCQPNFWGRCYSLIKIAPKNMGQKVLYIQERYCSAGCAWEQNLCHQRFFGSNTKLGDTEGGPEQDKSPQFKTRDHQFRDIWK